MHVPLFWLRAQSERRKVSSPLRLTIIWLILVLTLPNRNPLRTDHAFGILTFAVLAKSAFVILLRLNPLLDIFIFSIQ